MSVRSKIPGILILLFIVIFAVLSFRASLPPAVIAASEADDFSAERAMVYLRKVAAQPHASGTAAHTMVRSYIIEHCRKRGLTVEIQSGIDIDTWSTGVNAAFVHNLIATLKGTNPDGKAILVASHYDSQINTPAAADDGAAVAAQLEVIDMLTNSDRLENDVIFLFTDSEEMGLDGANYFVDHYDRIDDIGLMLNFESRGNSGAAYSFETTPENGWMLREFRQAVKKPISNSLAYEIYKLMPNGTDFTQFKRTGITGLNSAFIDGWAYYHSPADTPDNLDQRSLQHHGDHMLGTLRHFGNMDLSSTRSNDVIFFNPFGGWLLIYSQGLDLPLIVFTLLLWLVCVIRAEKQKRVRWKSVLTGTGLMLLSLLVAMALLFGYQQLTSLLVAPGSVWEASNKYQMGNTLIVIAGLALIAFAVTFKRSISKSFESTYLGALLFLLILIIPIRIFAATGGYILYFPVMIALLIYLTQLLMKVDLRSGVAYAVGQMIALFIPLGLWIPMVYMIFIVFGMSLPYGAMVFLAFFFPMLIPSFKMASMLHHRLVFYIGLLIAVAGQVLLITGKGYTETTPLHTSMNYVVDGNKQEAQLMSFFENQDEWSNTYFKGTEQITSTVATLNPDNGWQVYAKQAAVVDTTFMTYSWNADSLNSHRHIRMQLVPAFETYKVRLRLPEGTMMQDINGEAVTDRERTERQLYLTMLAVPKDTFHISFSFPLGAGTDFAIQEQRIGIPSEVISSPMPSHIVHDLYWSNLYMINWSDSF